MPASGAPIAARRGLDTVPGASPGTAIRGRARYFTSDRERDMSRTELDPSHILQVGMGFWASKTVLSAVELELFTQLGSESMTGEELGERLDLHPRGIHDFLDTLVALRFLDRDGDGSDGRY